ncbi:helix-turn-helix domain-containing protein [Candidatus Ozemobacteraceae bacterium]|nr:helix-turn-helix domain-containing protein [Candidatus Ozemobacteraceae bacterium]
MPAKGHTESRPQGALPIESCKMKTSFCTFSPVPVSSPIREVDHAYKREAGRIGADPLRAVKAVADGVPQKEVAKVLGVDPTTVCKWFGKFLEDPELLRTKPTDLTSLLRAFIQHAWGHAA